MLAASAWTLLEARFIARRLRGASGHPLHKADMVLPPLLSPPLSIYCRRPGAVRFRVLSF